MDFQWCICIMLWSMALKFYIVFQESIHVHKRMGTKFIFFWLIIPDINTAPTITNLPLASAVSVPENSALGVSVFQLSFSDLDTTDTHVVTATYTPSSGGTIFTMDTTSMAQHYYFWKILQYDDGRQIPYVTCSLELLFIAKKNEGWK